MAIVFKLWSIQNHIGMVQFAQINLILKRNQHLFLWLCLLIQLRKNSFFPEQHNVNVSLPSKRNYSVSADLIDENFPDVDIIISKCLHRKSVVIFGFKTGTGGLTHRLHYIDLHHSGCYQCLFFKSLKKQTCFNPVWV